MTDAPQLGHDGLPFHTEPLRWWARHHHKGKPLEELVPKQRYRRKRVAKVEVVP